VKRFAPSAFVLIACFAAMGAALAEEAPSPSPAPSTRQALSDAWWTGPLLAPGAGTLPRGHWLFEPYLFHVMQYASYDAHGNLQPAPHMHTTGSLSYIIYGLTDRLNIGAIPTFAYNATPGRPNSSHVGIGDWALLAQYGLTRFHTGSLLPTTAIAVQETLPTGQYDHLDANAADGFGSGVYSTKISFYSQTLAWIAQARIMRLRLNFSDTFSGRGPVNGVSVYGTPAGFSGWVKPGDYFTIDAAEEYSITRSWVAASDVVYAYTGPTRLGSSRGIVNADDLHSVAIAPAIEYNWTADAGIIVGFRYFVSGRNASASFTPVAAINLVH
jgi:hypothetical protein